MILGGDTVTRLRGVTVAGEYNNPATIDWTEGTLSKVDYTGCSFQPMISTEDVVSQQRVESTHRAFLPAGADVLSTDRLRFDGLDYQVEGDPEQWRIRGVDHHLEVRCSRVAGG